MTYELTAESKWLLENFNGIGIDISRNEFAETLEQGEQAAVARALNELQVAKAFHRVEHAWSPELLTCMVKHRKKAKRLIASLTESDQ